MRALDFLFLTRPILLLPVWTVYLLYYDYYLPGSPLESAVLLDLAALSLIMAAAYIINQIYDIESDRLNNKLGFFNPPVELTIRQGWLAFALLNCSALAYATFARMELLLPLGVIALAGILYSAPPVRAKDRPLPGLLFNAL
ncbi:MAG: hypothetical protein ACE5GA_05905, partial [Candidatus Zixiibacteriota bacterium]